MRIEESQSSRNPAATAVKNLTRNVGRRTAWSFQKDGAASSGTAGVVARKRAVRRADFSYKKRSRYALIAGEGARGPKRAGLLLQRCLNTTNRGRCPFLNGSGRVARLHKARCNCRRTWHNCRRTWRNCRSRRHQCRSRRHQCRSRRHQGRSRWRQCRRHPSQCRSSGTTADGLGATADDAEFQSARSARQHKAWGASPRITMPKLIEARGAGDSAT